MEPKSSSILKSILELIKCQKCFKLYNIKKKKLIYLFNESFKSLKMFLTKLQQKINKEINTIIMA